MTTKEIELEVSKMRATGEKVTMLLRTLANSDRLPLLHLPQGERCVGELEEELRVQQPRLSPQLTVLRKGEPGSTRGDGTRICCAVSDPTALTAGETLYRLFCTPRGKRRAH